MTEDPRKSCQAQECLGKPCQSRRSAAASTDSRAAFSEQLRIPRCRKPCRRAATHAQCLPVAPAGGPISQEDTANWQQGASLGLKLLTAQPLQPLDLVGSFSCFVAPALCLALSRALARVIRSPDCALWHPRVASYPVCPLLLQQLQGGACTGC